MLQNIQVVLVVLIVLGGEAWENEFGENFKFYAKQFLATLPGLFILYILSQAKEDLMASPLIGGFLVLCGLLTTAGGYLAVNLLYPRHPRGR